MDFKVTFVQVFVWVPNIAVRLIKTENEMLNDFLPNLTFLKNLTNPIFYVLLKRRFRMDLVNMYKSIINKFRRN